MFVRQNQQQFRNSNADVQIFYGDGGATGATVYRLTWNKPPGVSHVYMMAIGGGGNGDSTTGGGSGAVTVWYGAAQNVPDNVMVSVGFQSGTRLGYRNTDNQIITLIQANNGSSGGGAGGTAFTANAFTASGFYQSTAGQNGSSSSISASATTFLSGGAASSTNLVGNYNYTLGSLGEKNGFFLLQPIIVGLGGMGSGNGGIGCGGGVNGKGGQGMVLIASW